MERQYYEDTFDEYQYDIPTEQTRGYLESKAFVEREFNDDYVYGDSDISSPLEEDREFVNIIEAQLLENWHYSHRLQDEFEEDSDDEDPDEIDVLENLRYRAEAMNESIHSRGLGSQNSKPSLQQRNNQSSSGHSNENVISDETSGNNNIDHPLASEQKDLFEKNGALLDIFFPINTRDLNESQHFINANEQAEVIVDSLVKIFISMRQIADQYIALNKDMLTPDAILYLVNLQRFHNEIGEQIMHLFNLFEAATNKYLENTHIFVANSDKALEALNGVNRSMQQFLCKISKMVEDLTETLADPGKKATRYVEAVMMKAEAKELRKQNFFEHEINERLRYHAPYFLSEARLMLPYSTPLTKLFASNEVKYLTRFHLRDLIEMTIRLNIPRSYTITGFSDEKQYYKKRINADPATQLFLLLAFLSHGLSLKTLEKFTKVDFRKISCILLSLEKFLFQTRVQLLECSKTRANFHYRKFLSANAPDNSTEECNLMEENVALFIGVKSQKSYLPTRNAYFFINKGETHHIKYQIVCDLFGLIWDVSGLYGGSLDVETIYGKSKFESRITRLDAHDGKKFVVYGDSDYYTNIILSSQLLAEYKSLPDRPLTEIQKLRNRQYARYRIKIERTFGTIVSLFKGLDKWFKTRRDMEGISNAFKLVCLFVNCYTVLYKTPNNQILRQHLDDKNRKGPAVISLATMIEYWILDEYRAILTQDGEVI